MLPALTRQLLLMHSHSLWLSLSHSLNHSHQPLQLSHQLVQELEQVLALEACLLVSLRTLLTRWSASHASHVISASSHSSCHEARLTWHAACSSKESTLPSLQVRSPKELEVLVAPVPSQEQMT